MSTLNVNQINSADGSDDTLVLNGQNTCKAWITFNGTGTIAIDDSYGVDSIADNGTGDYDVNFTTNFASVDFSMASCTGAFMDRALAASKAVGSANFETRSGANSAQDADNVCLIFFGDQ